MPSDLNLDFVLIPAGEFKIGSDPAADHDTEVDEMPQHHLNISDFYLMRQPVTNAQYAQFVAATGHRAPLFWENGKFAAGKEQQPVVGVSYADAIAFCRWAGPVLGKAVRLPTEAEWEKAARGSDGRIYPWGNRWEAGRCNNADARIGGPSPVGQFSPQGDSPYGIADVAGNVQEWCSSLFGPYPYDPADGREAIVYELNEDHLLPKQRDMGGTSNPQADEASWGKSCIRGGSWRESKLQSRCAYRSWAAPMHRSDDTGFRCCYEP